MISIGTNFPGIYVNSFLTTGTSSGGSSGGSSGSGGSGSNIPTGNAEYVIFIDQTTNKKYKVYVNDGKLKMSEVSDV